MNQMTQRWGSQSRAAGPSLKVILMISTARKKFKTKGNKEKDLCEQIEDLKMFEDG